MRLKTWVIVMVVVVLLLPGGRLVFAQADDVNLVTIDEGVLEQIGVVIEEQVEVAVSGLESQLAGMQLQMVVILALLLMVVIRSWWRF